ncbi:MAG: T9SS type A sorting domain-containing protein [Sphingobacteriales bacterium]|nr:MAG: T9SS type A sorting domain-containing protein [Sphingobacteriales bacterium]
MLNFTQLRHYMDWEKLESNPGSYTYSPTHSGGWNYDEMYRVCKAKGILVLADLKTLPNWMLESYPEADRDHENVPVKYGADFSKPQSYIEQAKVAFQYVARYGSNTKVKKSLLSVNGNPRWTGDPINTVKVGLGYIKYIECDNERDKWWKGRKGYQTAYEYAANLSAFYDGHKNTMGAGVGVKNADPTMQVVMGGLASANTEYLLGMIEWCKLNRGYKADGTVNLCWDIINYHWYSHDAQMIPNSVPTRGVAPELGGTFEKAKAFVNAANRYANGMPVWVTEVGYDANPNSPMRAIPIGNKTILQTQADWILRSSLLYARAGVERIFFYQAYDDNFANPIQYGSSGLLNQDRSRKPAADYIHQAEALFGKYNYKSTLSYDPIVDLYEYNGQQAYVMYVPDEIGRTKTYTLDLPGADSAKIHKPVAGAASFRKNIVQVKNGKVAIALTETPLFVIPQYPDEAVAMKIMSVDNQGVKKTEESALTNDPDISVYPSPAEKHISIAFSNTNYKEVNISVADAVMGRVYNNINFSKPGESFLQTIDISQLPRGVCLVMIKQDGKTIVKRVIKNN